MAIPAIPSFAASGATQGKQGRPAGNDQGSADFASALAQQRPAESGSENASSAPPASSTATAPQTAGVQTPLLPEILPSPLGAEIAIDAAANAETRPLDLPGTPTAASENAGRLVAANALAKEKGAADENDRGQINALEQIARNPGLGLGLTTTATAGGQGTAALEKPGKHSENDASTSIVDAPLTATAAPAPLPMTFSAAERFDGEIGSGTTLPSGSSATKQTLSEAANQTANLAGELGGSNSASPQSFSAIFATQHPSEASTAPPPNVAVPLQNPNWGRNFGEGVVWMAKNDQQSAQININPPQLGPVQITLHLNGDQASAVFASPHAEVRQAIQDAMPQLRDMLAASGINLGQADVGSQGSASGREFAAQQGNQNRYGDENAILSPDTQFADKSPSQPILRGRGLVDLFA